MFTKEEKAKLKEISDLFNKMDDIYNSFSNETQDKIREYHNETGSIPHCIRSGITGTEELLEEE